ncbi:hypothetical protein BDZ89DRAFT_1045193 [Hymenopellis radicata]|nr:hypothetical protein BDZ89DRAFT_1045193 [Hymenopellis radicata]
MSKSLIDHAVLMRSVLGEPVMEMDVPDRDEGQSVVQAKLSRHIRLKSPAPICDEEPLLTVHSDDEPPPARRRKRSIKSKATVESDDEEDNSVFVDKASSKTRSHRGARESIVDMEAVESEEELPKDPKGKGKASVKKDVVNRIQRSKASPDTRQKALAAIQAFGKEYPGFLSSDLNKSYSGMTRDPSSEYSRSEAPTRDPSLTRLALIRESDGSSQASLRTEGAGGGGSSGGSSGGGGGDGGGGSGGDADSRVVDASSCSSTRHILILLILPILILSRSSSIRGCDRPGRSRRPGPGPGCIILCCRRRDSSSGPGTKPRPRSPPQMPPDNRQSGRGDSRHSLEVVVVEMRERELRSHAYAASRGLPDLKSTTRDEYSCLQGRTRDPSLIRPVIDPRIKRVESGAFNFAGDEPIDVKQEAKQGGSRFQSSSKRNVPVLETIVVSTDEDGPATKHGYQRDGFVVDSDEDHSDVSNKRRNKKKVSHREMLQSEDLPEVANMFKALDQPAKERRKYLEDEYTRYEEDNEAEGAAERLAAQGRKPKSSANVDGPILQEYCEAGHPLHILYLKHPNAGLPMSTLTPTYRAHAKLDLWTFSFDHPALKRFDPKGFASFVAFLSFAHEDMFANIGNCDPDTFELLKYQTATGSTGHNLVFAEDNGTVVSLEVGLCVSSNLRTSVARTPTSKGHGFTYIPMDQSHNLLTAVLGVVFGFREKSVAFTTVEVDGGCELAQVIPSEIYIHVCVTPSTPSRSSPSKPVQPVAYPATQPFAAATLKGNTLKVYKDGKQEVPADSLVVVGNCINTYTAQDDTVLSFNVQFVIILALPPSTSVPSTPQKSRESNTHQENGRFCSGISGSGITGSDQLWLWDLISQHL